MNQFDMFSQNTNQDTHRFESLDEVIDALMHMNDDPLANAGTNVVVSRERPFGKDCGGELPDDAIDCRDSFHYRSFFSGHSAFSFTGGGVFDGSFKIDVTAASSALPNS